MSLLQCMQACGALKMLDTAHVGQAQDLSGVGQLLTVRCR
jgi:hypothetical protein